MTNREKYILSIYEELSDMGKHENVKLVKNTVNDGIYIKKTLKNYKCIILKKRLPDALMFASGNRLF